MAPRMRRQHTAAQTTSVVTPTDPSTRSVSSKKKGKVSEAHLKLPRLVIRRPRKEGGESEVSLGKHTQSPQEGPMTNTEMRATPGLLQPAKRVKAICSEDMYPSPPHLELSDDEVELEGHTGHTSNVPHVRKLRREETLVWEGDLSSLDNNASHSSGSDDEDSDSEEPEDEEHDNLVGFAQTTKLSQRMALEAKLEPAAEINIQCSHTPGTVLPSILSNCETLRSRAQAGAHDHFGSSIGDIRFDGRPMDSEFAVTTSQGRKTKQVRFEHCEDTASGSGFNDTVSDGQQPVCVRSEGQQPTHVCSKGQQPTCVHSEGQQPMRVHSEGQQPMHAHSEGQCTPPQGR
ncbi:hypothetical protein BJY52DRAFT_1197099 [Lactarius psammicola]|nr:hypothetical protein BJY52DRAFT_1197099 [Lactarius psammicola]